MSRSLIAIAIALSVSACGGESAIYNSPVRTVGQGAAILAGANIVMLNTTGKTIDDHVMGWAIGKDCSILRASHGYPYCKDLPAPVATFAVTTYCYKSLASVSCYDQPMAFDQARFVGKRTDDLPVTDLLPAPR